MGVREPNHQPIILVNETPSQPTTDSLLLSTVKQSTCCIVCNASKDHPVTAWWIPIIKIKESHNAATTTTGWKISAKQIHWIEKLLCCSCCFVFWSQRKRPI